MSPVESGRAVRDIGALAVRRLRVAFVHNFCSHYTRRTFELLAERLDVQFLFESHGDEWYWPSTHGVQRGAFRHAYLRGFRAFGLRVAPGLVTRLLTGRYDCVVKSINGRVSLPLTYLLARVTGRPFVLWTGLWARLDTPVHRAAFPIMRFIYRRADAVVVYGQHVKRYLVTEGVADERVFVAPHAVDNAAYARPVPAEALDALRARLGLLSHDKVVLYVGRLEAGKGVDDLLAAFARVADTHAVLVIAGSGTDETGFRTLAAHLGIDRRVRFAGYVPIDQTVSLYAMACMCVVPSYATPRWKEPWGLVVNEAMNQGVPIVATDAVGAAAGGLVEDGVTGLVVPERDVAALATAIDRLLADPDSRQRLGDAARARISGWTQERMAEVFVEAIGYALQQAPGRRARHAEVEESDGAA